MPLRIHSLDMGMARAYLLETRAGLVLVDAGLPRLERRVLRLVKRLGRSDLRLIFITHAHLDHYGSAAALRRLTGAPIAIHQADAGSMALGETPLGSARGWGRLVQGLLPLLLPALRPEPAMADLVLDAGDNLQDYGLDAVMLHTPGHTPGSGCLLVEGRFAFVGDLLSTRGRPHVQNRYATDWTRIHSSLAQVQALAPQWVYPGHGRRPLGADELRRLMG